jgi:streptogramin lyase
MKVDAASGQITSFFFLPPRGISWPYIATHGIGKDSKGDLWFGLTWRAMDETPDGELVQIDPETDAFKRISLPAQMRNVFSVVTIDADAKDKIWSSAVSGAIRFDPETTTFSYWHNLATEINQSSFTYGTTGDSAGNGWWTAPLVDRVEMADPKTGEAHTFIMRPPWADEEAVARSGDPWANPGKQFPRRLGADKNGTAVWVPNYYGRNLAKIDIKSKAVTYYKIPFGLHPYFVTVAKNHVVWMNLMSDDRVAAFDPQLDQWTLYRLPVNGCESRNITVDDRTGEVWVPCFRASKVFRLQFRTPK